MLFRSIAQSKGLPVYVFSGQLEIKEFGDQADITKRNLKRAGFTENVNLFFKSGTYKLLLDKVLNDLKSEFSVFYEYPSILDNVIHYGVNKDCVKDLLLWMKDKTLPFPDYDSLRRIIYDEVINLRLKPFFGKEYGQKQCLPLVLCLCISIPSHTVVPWVLYSRVESHKS